MSEYLERLSARTLSDIRRAVPFETGMKHFNELVLATLEEMKCQVDRMEMLVKFGEEKR